MILQNDFYLQSPVDAAKGLLGAYLCRVGPDGQIVRARICELELYTQDERGCHAFNGMTQRNEAMFLPGGHVYVYLCYGLHNMLNIILGATGYAAAVLIRALEYPGCNGPGKLTKTLGITRAENKMNLTGDDKMWIEGRANNAPVKILAGPRIGIDYAGPDALLPWRFVIADSKYISRPIK